MSQENQHFGMFSFYLNDTLLAKHKMIYLQLKNLVCSSFTHILFYDKTKVLYIKRTYIQAHTSIHSYQGKEKETQQMERTT